MLDGVGINFFHCISRYLGVLALIPISKPDVYIGGTLPTYLEDCIKVLPHKLAKVNPDIFSYVLAQTTPFVFEMHAMTLTYLPPVPQTLPLAVFESPSGGFGNIYQKGQLLVFSGSFCK